MDENIERRSLPPADIDSTIYTHETDFTKLEFNFETKLALDMLACEYFDWHSPHSRLKLFTFLKNKINGESREYFIAELFEDEKAKDYFFDVVLEVLNESN